MTELLTSNDDAVLANQSHRLREGVASYIVKDWALAHLPPEGTPPPQGRKPKLVLLEGLIHASGTQAAFDSMHLPITLNELPVTDEHTRYRERLNDMAFVAANYPDSKTARANMWLADMGYVVA